jgi:cobalt/nickel transport system permease protein
MHITEGVLTGPSVVVTNAIGLGLVAWGTVAMRKFSREQHQKGPLLGMAGAFIFFVSLIHIPAFAGMTCSHPCGTPLAGILLGPGVAIGLAACSLLIQALFFAHGGLSTLGANVITLGLAGAGSAWLIFRVCRKMGLSLGISAGMAGLIGDIATYAVNILQLGLHFVLVAPHPQYDFWGYAKVLAIAYFPVQAPLAVAEMLVTGYAVHAIQKQRPEVLQSLGVEGKKGALAALLLLALIPGPALISAEPAKAQKEAFSPVAVSPAAENFGALDDMTDHMAEKAGTPSREPYINLEKYHDIWSSLMMLAGLVVGFILGRRWHMLFDKPQGNSTAREGT